MGINVYINSVSVYINSINVAKTRVYVTLIPFNGVYVYIN
nr:MAG TPA: hypothetical protein [Caudoviricetes sp.]